MSALPPIADIPRRKWDVSLVPQADISSGGQFTPLSASYGNLKLRHSALHLLIWIIADRGVDSTLATSNVGVAPSSRRCGTWCRHPSRHPREERVASASGLIPN